MDQEALRRKLMATFQAELQEHLSALNAGLLALEKGLPKDEQKLTTAELFRAAHSLKGAARAIELSDIEMIAHRMEDVLGAIQQEELSPKPEIFDALFAAADSLKAAMDAHLRGAALAYEQRDAILLKLSTALRGTAESQGEIKQDRPETQTVLPPKAKAPESPPLPEPPLPPIIAKPELRKKTEPEPPPAAAPSPPPPAKAITPEDTIRVATSKLDAFMDRIGELMVARMRADQRLRELNGMQSRMIGWQKSWRRVSAHYVLARKKYRRGSEINPLLDFMGLNEGNLKAMSDEINLLIQNFTEDHSRLTLLADDLQDGVRRVRMLPIAALFDQFPRMVRDMARQQDKEVDFKIEGAETQADRKVIEVMKDPIIHLLRNAVDHGIETQDKRSRENKPCRGTIHLRAAQKGNTIVLEVADDGAGIDTAVVKQKALAKGLLTSKEAAGLSEKETVDLIFHTGLSTTDDVTDLSGRGVGLDVVRENLEKLHGRIEVNTSPRGTTFIMILPLTLTTSHVLLLEVSGNTLAVPSTSVERILRIVQSDIGSIDGKPAIRVGDRVMPLVEMHRVLEFPCPEKPKDFGDKVPVVVMGVAEKRISFRVDAVRNAQEVVVKTPGIQLKRVRNVSGAAILGGGEVVIILNVADLIKSAAGRAMPAAMPAQTQEPVVANRVLVVDDSITTRTLEKNILQNAGYEVHVAVDGEEAWALIQSQPLDAIVADIDMPRMNGFDLTAKVKTDDRFKELPVILVSSLESPQDKIRGMEAGADSYIVKSGFDQAELLETIARLIA